METFDWHFDMFYLRRRINVASGTGTVRLPTLKQNLQGTYPRINQHVIFQPRRNVNKTHPGKWGHTFNLHLYKTACHRRLPTTHWLNYSTIDTTCMFNHRSCSRVTLYTAGHLHTAVPHCSHSRAPIVHTAVPRENNEHGCVYLRCRAVCKLPGCVEGHPWCSMKCFISKDVEGLDSERWIPLGGCTRIPRGL